MYLAPPQLLRQGKPLSALFSEGNLEFYEQRDREFQWSDEPITPLSVLETCANKILIGLENGEIKIFSTVDLQCKETLAHPKLESKVTCLQCTCTEVIACYEDSSACIWNIQSGDLIQRFCIGDRAIDHGYATLLRVKGTKLVVARQDFTIGIWNYENCTVKFVSGWLPQSIPKRLEIRGTHIILLSTCEGVSVYNFDGTLLQIFGNICKERDMAIYGNYAILWSNKSNMGIWDINTGESNKELRGSGSEILCVSAENNHVLTADASGYVVIWSFGAMIEGRPAALMKISDPSHCQTGPRCCCHYSLGRNYFVRLDPNRSVIIVTDFL